MGMEMDREWGKKKARKELCEALLSIIKQHDTHAPSNRASSPHHVFISGIVQHSDKSK